MTCKDIEIRLTQYCDGASFCTVKQVAGFLGQKNLGRVKQRYLLNLPVLEGTRSYYIPDVARNIFYSLDYKNVVVR